MRLALDTNRLTDLLRGDREVGRIVERGSEIYVPFIAVAELKAGFVGGNREERNNAQLRQFFDETNTTLLFADRATLDYYARLFIQLRRAGTPIPDNDIWIAALALQHDLTLVTRDHHFQKIPQLLLA